MGNGAAVGEATKRASVASTGSRLEEAAHRAEERVGKASVSGRYHRSPTRLKDYYKVDEAKVLGKGFNGSVFLAKRGEQKYAVKPFKIIGVSKDSLELLETECEIFLSMDHPHVARLVDVYETDATLMLVMECMEGGELFDRVSERRTFREQDAAQAAYQMLRAIAYIHTKNIVHRDLKLENFMYEKSDTDHLKLIDFGFGKVWNPDTYMRSSCGTLSYVAPEVLQSSYRMECDLWSLGVIVFILLSGYMPFPGASQSEQCARIKSGRYHFIKHAWSKVSETGFGFVQRLLVVEPAERMTALQALDHEWIRHWQERNNGRPGSGTGFSVDKETVDALCSFAEASNFRKACMSLMAWSLSCDERAAVRDAFLDLDTTRSGTITLREFRDVLSTKFSIEDEAVKRAFAALDTSHDEEIHYTEFLAAMVNTRIAVHDELLKKTFERFDVDHSGVITVENLTEVLGAEFNGEQVQELLREADLNGDGHISYQEFMSYLKGGAAKPLHLEAADKLIQVQLTGQSGSGLGGTKASDASEVTPARSSAKSSTCVVL